MMPEDRHRMVGAWLVKDDQALADAITLHTRESPTGTMNRCYYAMFYAALALAIHDGFKFHKHGAIIPYIHREYVKAGRISKDLGRSLLAAFDHRTEADYHAMVHFGLDDVAELLDQARRFVAKLKLLLQPA